MRNSWKTLQPYLLATPQVLTIAGFLIVPIAAIAIVSFWEFTGYSMSPGFTLENYRDIFSSSVYLNTYLNTFKFVGIVWFLCLLIGFPIAYFLAFHVESLRWQVALFLVCTIPFLTSNVIRTISWLPFLGTQGLINQTLIWLGLVDRPIEMFLYSDFAVVLALVHLYTLFAIVPIFNSLMRIDRALVAAAYDAGASTFQVMQEVIVPLAKSGIAIASIFIVTLVMGEFVTVRMMGGGQVASIGLLIRTQIGRLQYPFAAANAVVLLAVTLLLVTGILRAVDIRQEL
ncbi:MAG: ABC transporter permease [Cyanobacteria bacterium J06642_2]